MFQRIRHNNAGNVDRSATTSGQLEGQQLSGVSASPLPPLHSQHVPSASPPQHHPSQVSNQINSQRTNQIQMSQQQNSPTPPPTLLQQQVYQHQQSSSTTPNAGQQLQTKMQSKQISQNISSRTSTQQSHKSIQPQSQLLQTSSLQKQSQPSAQSLPSLSASQATSLPKQHKLHSIIHTNPIVRYFHITRFTGTMGTELAWQMYDAQRISDSKVSIHGHFTSIQGCRLLS